jgi:hypothetical protein
MMCCSDKQQICTQQIMHLIRDLDWAVSPASGHCPQASGGTEKHNWVATFGTPPPTAHDLWTREVSITGELGVLTANVALAAAAAHATLPTLTLCQERRADDHLHDNMVCECCVRPLLAGYVMWFGLLLGYPFAMYWPRMARCIRGTCIGRFLNDFTNFFITHIAMWVIFYVALILHPYPGTPSQHKNGRSTTWVRLTSVLMWTSAQHILHAIPCTATPCLHAPSVV